MRKQISLVGDIVSVRLNISKTIILHLFSSLDMRIENFNFWRESGNLNLKTNLSRNLGEKDREGLVSVNQIMGIKELSQLL